MYTRKPHGRIRGALGVLAAGAMIAAVMPMTGAAAADEPAVVDSNGQTVVDLIVDGGTDSTTWVDIGEVQVTNDATNLYVKYVVDTGSWCLTSTAVDIQQLGDDPFATTNKGAPKIGKFQFKADLDCLTEKLVTIPLKGLSGEIQIAAHADTLLDHIGDLETALPATANLRVSYPGPDSYFKAFITNGGVLDDGSPYTSWCVDVQRHISPGATYLVDVYSSYEDLPTGTVDYPQNMDLVNWLVNNMNVGTETAFGPVNKYDVANAIWKLIDNTPYTWGTLNIERVDAMVAAAEASGEGFVPGCDDVVAIIMATHEKTVQSTIVQTTFIELGVRCGEETAWAGVWNGVEGSPGSFEDKFVDGSTWAGYFQYSITG